MKRIVIGTDGSPDAAKAVEDGLALAHDLGAAVTFVCARTGPTPLLGEPFYQQELAAETARSRRVVAGAMRKAADAGVDADYEVLEGAPADAILAVAETHDADLIVVGSRGLGAVQSVVFGSVSKALVARAKRPVLVVKESRHEPEREHSLVNNGAVLR